jgi:hypothetical protein
MKFYLKSPVYFEITVPDGTNRSQVSNLFHEQLEKAFKKLINNIRLDDDDLRSFQELFGPVNIRLITEIDALNKSAKGSKVPDFIEY